MRAYHGERRTMNDERRTMNHERRTTNVEPRTTNVEPRTSNVYRPMIATPHGRLPAVIFFTTCFAAKSTSETSFDGPFAV
jgi:hypothetical protein